MRQHGAQSDAESASCRQYESGGIVEYRWTTRGGEILGHRNERLIAELREVLWYEAAYPELPIGRFPFRAAPIAAPSRLPRLAGVAGLRPVPVTHGPAVH